ncbi:MAG: Undecaprenyl-phosphate mannosyltransferase [Microgenomates bacterium OLB22]|nr:MAG: Undecaprenyl-phosphate mannosyltransferase [Microgenomates bacterium OLB22]
MLDQIRYEYELIIVVDGLVDSTKDLIKKANIPKTVCISYKENQGKSYAIRVGMQYARGDYVMFIDAGEEIDPNGISMLIEHMEWYEADIVVGSKRHPVSRVNYSPIRRILSLGYYFLVRILFGLNIKDTQAGIKIFKRRVMKKILPRLVEKKFTGDLEILVVARKLGYRRIFEAPIKLDFRLATLTSAATLHSIWGMFYDTMSIFYRSTVLNFYTNPGNNLKLPKDIEIYRSKKK